MFDPEQGELVLIDESNWRAALRVRVGNDQLAFVADHQPVALVILAKAHVRPEGRIWEPCAFVVDDRIVAVLALAHGDGVSEMVNLAVDVDHQRRGVGGAVLDAVIDRSRFVGSEAIELTAHPSNRPALSLYQRGGFTPTGELRGGEPVWRLALSA